MAASEQTHIRFVQLADDLLVEIVGYQDADAADGEYDWYDLFDADTGECLNEGDPLYELPTDDAVAEYLADRQSA